MNDKIESYCKGCGLEVMLYRQSASMSFLFVLMDYIAPGGNQPALDSLNKTLSINL